MANFSARKSDATVCNRSCAGFLSSNYLKIPSKQMYIIGFYVVLNVLIFAYLCVRFTSPTHIAKPSDNVHTNPQENTGFDKRVTAFPFAEAQDPPLDSLERKMFSDLRDCPTNAQVPAYRQTGDYWILANYIPASMEFRCDETVTYATHGEYPLLDNLKTITKRWQGPVSIAVYATGADFRETVNRILYLRDCWDGDIKKYVSFHLIFHTDHVPPKIPRTQELIHHKTDCEGDPPKWTDIITYRKQKKLIYPINIARNVARRAASTYFMAFSDLELYPSTNFIPEFLKMLKKPDISNTTSPKVFVFPVFEVKKTVTPPETKPKLLPLLRTGDAVLFHNAVCSICHSVPHAKEWSSMPESSGLSVTHVGKRIGEYKRWEPFYVGTQREPIYDEKMSWEGKRDKMVQMFAMCVLDYEFLVMDNAFLVHRPGIKKSVDESANQKIFSKITSNIINNHIVPEYRILYGNRDGCIVG